MVIKKKCRDCPPSSGRAAPYPGPRCSTHNREIKKVRRQAAHEKRVGKVYGLKPGQYEQLYAAQGGVCYICQRATGRTRKLSVDHNHETGYVRGLLCRPCNNFIGHLRDDPELAYRMYDYLVDPPAFRTIGEVKTDD